MKNLPEKIRSKKLESRVDLTAMVSVSFLLIVFFMVTIDLAKPKMIEYYSGERGGCGPEPICNMPDEIRTYTILLDDNDKLITYHGLLFAPLQGPKESLYGKEGIQRELSVINSKVHAYTSAIGKPNRGPIVIIKPSKKCNYKNLVDILDEMAIAKIDTYAIVNEFTPEESQLLAAN
ncbi:hypothetical protein FVB9288_01596 [Flavobacterium sp. CECT 9288]|uniref:ExbD/TolR family protein n=1 Tax=Flavobacterium sp. CECT 9288 TaxID=2845819 RepID=UPI001E59A296|nr:biopolymer transporter ExbD [Flavobacterium sp. CECT 9288]CAH0335932.1 hypothetical protein FVB9288_01596 [Flavobacterium sp. CECT 9288]